MQKLDWLEKRRMKSGLPSFKAGDTVRVHVKISEGDKERVQIFEGAVIKIHRRGIASSFTVRKVSYGVGVERIFPFHSPVVSKIELVQEGKVRRAKLYYIRKLSGRKARIDVLKKTVSVIEDDTSTDDELEIIGEKTLNPTTRTKAEVVPQPTV